MNNNQIVSVIGLGKAGLPLACVIADAGHTVLGVDLNKKRCTAINSGKNPIPEEPGLKKRIAEYGGKKIKATTDPVAASKKSQIHIVIVPIFIDDAKQPQFKFADQAFTNIAKSLKKGDLVILETTVPPGVTETRFKKILEDTSKLKAGQDFHLAYSPERIMTGYSISRFTKFPKVVGGYTKQCGKKAFSFYKTFAKKAELVSNIRTAEMIKVCEGVYRDVNIGLANELKRACGKLDIDFNEMRAAANHDYCNIHQAGLGVGGHCIPVYPWFLINEMRKQEMDMPITNGARAVNDAMICFWRDKVLEVTGSINKPIKKITIGVLGLNYRAGVKETAYSRALPFIKALEDTGFLVYVKDKFHSRKEIEAFGFKFLTDFAKLDVIIVLNKEDFPNISTLHGKVITI